LKSFQIIGVAFASAFALLLMAGAGGEKPAITEEERQAIRARVVELGTAMENAYGVEGLATYLEAVAYWESRFDPNATSDKGRILGLFQMGKSAAIKSSYGSNHLKLADLKDVDKSIILAARHAVAAIRRARSQGAKGDWLSARRWWKYPALVDDDDENELYEGVLYSEGLRKRFASALIAIGKPTAFMFQTPDVSAFPDDAKEIAKTLGVEL